ncbi:nucleotidyltransferase domain-containing protein [Deefgea salmonis]|uniref:Nucleotidyltransferase domain-containing protein n=1 Tax=Deefgea salmonis TaxID=2875502 RepID=A0ABS8BI63_9NEIS|nr:nucleotidyltransferase domain-containing protein [Deefgea salmonis]MCB5195403.1 nucleotidyltransferase domain-containing protein [Deefgea salmonis]
MSITTTLISSQRDKIAQRAAQLIHAGHAKNLDQARRQACLELGLSSKEVGACTVEIEAEMAHYQHLFSPDFDEDLLQLRQKSLALMDFFQQFEPYLIGSVLKGNANQHSDINLLVYSDDPKVIEIFLLNQQIDYSSKERKTQYRQTDSPTIAFWFDQTEVHLQILPSVARHQYAKKHERANYRQLQQLIANCKSTYILASEE